MYEDCEHKGVIGSEAGYHCVCGIELEKSLMECYECEGSGKVEGETCLECAGAGEVEVFDPKVIQVP